MKYQKYTIITLFLSVFLWCTEFSAAQTELRSNFVPKRLEPNKERNINDPPVRKKEVLPKLLSGSSVQVDNLSGIEVDSLGTLGAQTGGFGFKIWEGADRGVVDSLLVNLPTKTTSLPMQMLMRRLLLSSAEPPTGPTSDSLLALRAKLLLGMGNIVDVQELIARVPSTKRSNSIKEIEANIHFLLNDNARACEIAAGQVNDSMNQFWQQALIFCQMLAGENEKAFLGLSLMRELGTEVPMVGRLIEAIIRNERLIIDTFNDPTPLKLVLARIAKVDLPADVISTNDPSLLRAIAISPNADFNLRIDAAERATGAGALEIKFLRQIYAGADISRDVREQSFSRDSGEQSFPQLDKRAGPLERALLFQTVTTQEASMAKVEAMMKAFKLARADGRYLPVVRAFKPFLDAVVPSSEVLWFAPEAIGAYLSIGNPDGIKNWISILRASALFHEESKNILSKIAPIGKLLGVADFNEDYGNVLSLWWQNIATDPQATYKATAMFSLFEALGETVPDSLWAGFVPSAKMLTELVPDPSLEFRLLAAMKKYRRSQLGTETNTAKDISEKDAGIGQIILICLLLLGERGPAEASPGVLYQVISSLVALGLESEARSIALEAAIAIGA